MVTVTALAAVSLGMLLVAHACAHRVLSRRPEPPRELPPISVLKPLKGIDDALFENLASFARLDYPAYEVLCGVADAADPACAVVRRVQRAFPEARIRLVVCDRPAGRNPKVATLLHLERYAQNEHILISDSNVRARPAYLRAMVAELADPRVGLVSSVLAGAGEERAGALFENLQLAGFVVAGVCAAEVLVGHACVIGKSMLMRKRDLQRVGGLRSVRHVLAEDYVLGRRFQRAGFRVALSPHALTTVNQGWGVRRFLERHLRWSQMRRRLSPWAYLGEPLLNPTPFLLALLVCGRPMAIPLLAIKIASDMILLRRLRGHAIAIADLPAIAIKDLLLFACWLVGAFRRTVEWRGNPLRLARGSILLPPRRSAHPLREAA